MALRLAGEEFSVVQGLDAQGWPREVQANDADPGLKISQSGSGPALQFQQAAAITTTAGHLTLNPGGNVVLNPTGGYIEARGHLYFTQNSTPGAAVDEVRLNSVDIAAGDRRLAIAAEAGGVIHIGNDTLRFTAGFGIITTNAGPLILNPPGGVRMDTGADLQSNILNNCIAVDFNEWASPGAPAANKGRIYSKDNGAGKTQLIARFPTGAEIVLATEP